MLIKIVSVVAGFLVVGASLAVYLRGRSQKEHGGATRTELATVLAIAILSGLILGVLFVVLAERLL
jgi:hypothetical protein